MPKRLPVPKETQVLKNGSEIHWHLAFCDDKMYLRVPVICGSCRKERAIVVAKIRARRKTFTGYCHSCNSPILGRTNSQWKPGSHHPKWKGGHYINGNGYVSINIHALTGKAIELASHMAQVARGGATTVSEHRLVMALHLGRPLETSEVVHHKDGNRLNNDISNLELTSLDGHHKLAAKYYRLWRDALTRIAELEADIELLRQRRPE